MKTYADRLKAHLAEYKRAQLGTERSGTWSRGNRVLAYEHILAEGDARLNILSSIREAFWKYWDDRERAVRPPKLHRDFAHLNSSQAFAFNLFFPYLVGDAADADLLLRSLGVRPEPIVTWEFEKVLDDDERTNFDLWIQLESGAEVCVEVKLSESDFGACVPGSAHLAKLETIYEPRLRRMIAAEHLEPPAFFRRYQILRNIMYAQPNRHVVFVFPKQNDRLREGKRFIEAVVQTNREWVLCVHTEDLLGTLFSDSPGELRRHVELLREKYVLAPSEGQALSLAHSYTIEDYQEQLGTLVLANRGSSWISIVALLPNPPGGHWVDVGEKLRGTGSQVRFLAYMFGDLVLTRAVEEGGGARPSIVLDGFLGCAGWAQSPWKLLSAIGTWLRSPASIRGALRHLDDSLIAWHQQGRCLPTVMPTRLTAADELRPFVPHGTVPNGRIVQQFVDDALVLMQSWAPGQRQSPIPRPLP